MNKKTFISFGLLALLLVAIIPLWAYKKDGSLDSSSDAVAASDDYARELFQTNCGSCHTLARAGTDGVVGPDLDARLAGAAGPAQDDQAIAAMQSRVENAIKNGLGDGAMPAGILQASEVEIVANFVAREAGR
ncbi:MAG: c-type cytochrome [Solirubrobacterales bacterium]|nr:c-type cytochrome [Solirubrobacterales bacterium]MCB8971506.1 c-type cytochrome [Thermoleophilales bacterium]